MTRQELDAIFARISSVSPGLLDTLEQASEAAIKGAEAGGTFLQASAPLYKELSPITLRQLVQTARDALAMRTEMQRMLAAGQAANTGK
jgi:hypothetical protein